MKNKILSHLPGNFPWQVHWFNTIDSTNTHAKALAEQGAPHGTVIIAAQQTNGRGRMGRSFSSPAEKGIYLSVILRPDCTAESLMHLTCAVGTAMCNAIQAVCDFRPGIKWINDLIACNKKLGGILTELSIDPTSGLVRYAIIGIGINRSQTQEDFPAEIRDIAISLEMICKKTIPADILIAAMILELQNMDKNLLLYRNEIINAYRKDCITLGSDVVILQTDSKQYGQAVDVDENGSLIVKLSDGKMKTVNSGEVSVRGLYGYT